MIPDEVHMTVPKSKQIIDPIRHHIERLRILELDFQCQAMETISLGPDYQLKGNRIRGGLGHWLRAVSCARKEFTNCKKSPCPEKSRCFYYLAFEDDTPHPYAVKPVLDGKKTYAKDDIFVFTLVLIGDAIPYMYRFIKAFELLGREEGIGQGRGKFTIRDVSPVRIHEGTDFFTGGKTRRNQHVLRFLSPLTLDEEKQGIYTGDRPFPLRFFAENLIRRIINLTNFYGGGIDYDRKEMGEPITRRLDEILGHMEKVRCEKDPVSYEGTRHSSRAGKQGKPQSLKGVTGELELKGDLSALMPYLKIGEVIGTGSNTTIGFGRFEIRKE
jgi:CRISPR-associated endoribonuclease Cas6